MAVIQQILNWFGLVLLVFGAAALALAQVAQASPTFMLAAAVPFLVHIGASRADATSGIRAFSMAVNWVAAVLAASLAAVAFIGRNGTFVLFPTLACAAALYVWNAVEVALASLR